MLHPRDDRGRCGFLLKLPSVEGGATAPWTFGAGDIRLLLLTGLVPAGAGAGGPVPELAVMKLLCRDLPGVFAELPWFSSFVFSLVSLEFSMAPLILCHGEAQRFAFAPPLLQIVVALPLLTALRSGARQSWEKMLRE